MHKFCVAFLLFSLLWAIPLWGQEVFVRGDNQAATQVRTDFEKYTHYRLSRRCYQCDPACEAKYRGARTFSALRLLRSKWS